MSVCDTCPKPGKCCRYFVLDGGHWARDLDHPLEVLAALAAANLPFMPLRRSDAGMWTVWCPNLSREGRCIDYDHRPQLCRDYEPGTNSLCVLYVEDDQCQSSQSS